MQFCQILATYVIYTFEHHIVVVTEFAIREQLISESIILLLFAAISLFSVRQSRDITNMLPASAGRCCLFLWCFYAIGRLLNQFFVKTQVYPAVTVLLYFLFLVELAVFFTITMQMVRLRVASAEKAAWRSNMPCSCSMRTNFRLCIWISASFGTKRKIRRSTSVTFFGQRTTPLWMPIMHNMKPQRTS